MSKKYFERKVSKQDVIENRMTTFVTQPEMKMQLLQDESRLLKLVNEELMRRYGKQKSMAGRGVEKLVKVLLLNLFGSKWVSEGL